tara:strand:+ start:31 stop:363 length:333 start_codon:yes stop_codon:yes gene_type:complete
MMWIILALVISVILNIFLVWYLAKVLSKLLYTSDNIGDLYITFRMFEDFVSSLYDMQMFYGEPIIEELIAKTRLVTEELETFEEIYSLTTDIEPLEEELKHDRSTAEEDT